MVSFSICLVFGVGIGIYHLFIAIIINTNFRISLFSSHFYSAIVGQYIVVTINFACWVFKKMAPCFLLLLLWSTVFPSHRYVYIHIDAHISISILLYLIDQCCSFSYIHVPYLSIVVQYAVFIFMIMMMILSLLLRVISFFRWREKQTRIMHNMLWPMNNFIVFLLWERKIQK